MGAALLKGFIDEKSRLQKETREKVSLFFVNVIISEGNSARPQS